MKAKTESGPNEDGSRRRMDEPFIMIARSEFESPVWKKKRVFSMGEAWFDLIQLAAFKDHKRIIGTKMHEVKRGQVAGSFRCFEARWKWSKDKIKRFFLLLKSDSRIDSTNGTGITVITLTNYADYNHSPEENGTDNGTQTGQERATNGTKRKKGNEE